MRPGGPWLFDQCEVAAKAIALKGLSKRRRTALLSDLKGDYMLYSTVEGVNPGARVSESNPPRIVYALVCDYDHPFTKERLAQALDLQERAKLPLPHWIERSLSGNLHAIWFFAIQMIGPGDVELWKDSLLLLAKKIGADTFYPGFDPRSVFPTQIWTATGEGSWVWEDDEATKLYPLIRKELIEGVFEQAITAWSKARGDSESDLTPERVLPLLQEKFKERFEWPGDFVEGSMGPTFWLDESTSPKSAKVMRNGLYSFSETAASQGKTFWSWVDLLGEVAYSMHKATDFPDRLNGIWYDGKWYHIEPDGTSVWWRQEDSKAIARFLRGKRNMNPKVPKGAKQSELDDALEFIHLNRRVKGASPVAFQPPGVKLCPSGDGQKNINTCLGTVLPPSTGDFYWGPGGGFANLSAYLDAFMPNDSTGERQLDYLLAWMALGYQQAYNLRMKHGHVMVMVGEPGSGKTFFIEVVIKNLFRLVSKPDSYFTSDSRFNGPLYSSGVWAIDDVAKSHIDPVMLASKLKKELTQSLHTAEAKFGQPFPVIWVGRCIIGANLDVDSLQVIPALDEQSNLAKFILLKTCGAGVIDFKAPGLAEKIEAELPAFAAWLLQYQVPERLLTETRFGFKHYHHPEVKDNLDLSNANFSLVEYLKRWLADLMTTEELVGVHEVSYGQPELINSIEASWASDIGHNTPLTRQLYERRFVQRLTNLIDTGKIDHIRHVKYSDGSRKWVVDLRGVRNDLKKKKEEAL